MLELVKIDGIYYIKEEVLRRVNRDVLQAELEYLVNQCKSVLPNKIEALELALAKMS